VQYRHHQKFHSDRMIDRNVTELSHRICHTRERKSARMLFQSILLVFSIVSDVAVLGWSWKPWKASDSLSSRGLNAAYECKPFHEIYTNGTDLCQSMWGDAFQVVSDTDASGDAHYYTMGFYDTINPNTKYSLAHQTPWVITTGYGTFFNGSTNLTLDVENSKIQIGNILSGSGIVVDTIITAISGVTITVDTAFTADMSSTGISVHGFENVNGHPTCNLQYYHLSVAQSQQSGEYSACHSYKADACCAPDTLTSWSQMNDNYGDDYHVDRCGPLTESCENFFMMEACLYECDPSAGLYRRYNSSQCNYTRSISEGLGGYDCADGSNTWEMKKMPIRQGFCDDWFEACYNDKFCGADSGNFFECANKYVAPKTAADILVEDLIIIICVTTIIGTFLVLALGYIVYRERIGQGVFTPLKNAQDSDPDNDGL